MFVSLAYTSKLLRMRCIFLAHASNLWCLCFFNRCYRCVSNVYVCSDLTHTQVFGQRCLFVLCIHQHWYACVVLFRLMRQKYDVCVSLTDVSVVFLTCLCVLVEHIRWFLDKDVCLSCVYIVIDTHALYYSGSYVKFMMLVFLSETFVLCFSRICVFEPSTYVGIHTYMR